MHRKYNDIPVNNGSKEHQKQIVYKGVVLGHVDQVLLRTGCEELSTYETITESNLHLSDYKLPEKLRLSGKEILEIDTNLARTSSPTSNIGLGSDES